MSTEWTDDELLTELGRALAEEASVPPSVAAAGRSLFAWRDFAAGLATLTSDSAAAGSVPLIRSGRGARRSLAFEAPGLTVEVDVESDPDALRGYVVVEAGRPTHVVVETVGAEPVRAEVDEAGYFAIDAYSPSGAAFRLRCGGFVTPWIR
ncbi:hypothetical protein [Cryptosporangium minutisporangium]|uniref:Carboxypeptidase regulatory-like domain-containing protein n=1 Tax=Cryptosporangium minutisporangium TaxID=113569 RepID=A0ABP6SSQ5_9ACTN